MPTTAELPFYQANLARIPLRVFASESALPSDLPAVGYGQLVMVTTTDGVRGKVRLHDGTFINLFTNTTTIDNTVTNTTNNTVYQINDLPDPSILTDGSIPYVTGGATKSWANAPIEGLIQFKSVKAHRAGATNAIGKVLSAADFDTYQSCTAGLTLNLPTLADVPMWAEMEIARNTASAVYLAVSTGVTVNGLTNTNIAITKQYGIMVLKCIGTNTYVAYVNS